MRRHLEGAELDEPLPACRAVGGPQLVDAELGAMRVAGEIGKEAPKRPIDDRGRRRPLDLGEAPLELVETGAPAFVDARRLRGRVDDKVIEEGRKRVLMLTLANDR